MNGLILAGGKSSRMGEDKALLSINGKTLITLSQQLLTTCGCTHVLVNHPKFSNSIKDIYSEKGPTAGIHAALSHEKFDLSSAPLLVSAVDTPFIPQQALDALIVYGLRYQTSVYYQNLYLPTLIYDTSTAKQWLDEVLSDPNSRGPSLRELFRAIRAEKLDNSSSEWININRPSDYARAKAQQSNKETK
ncbi:molybdenum cofactor guanylyltransferase [Agaribacter flavus]|uniref:Molybdenum cofactor guanylyltransferase n=1 Tax=Agaribacter flavus TaxID=1902781 RepID=A0ABV7FXI8_9ALTE